MFTTLFLGCWLLVALGCAEYGMAGLPFRIFTLNERKLENQSRSLSVIHSSGQNFSGQEERGYTRDSRSSPPPRHEQPRTSPPSPSSLHGNKRSRLTYSRGPGSFGFLFPFSSLTYLITIFIPPFVAVLSHYQENIHPRCHSKAPNQTLTVSLLQSPL